MFEILDIKEKELYYPCSENKGADQFRGLRFASLHAYREADLHLSFCVCKKLVFS